MQLPALATLEHVSALAAALPAAVAEGNGVFEVDASALTRYDSSTIALLMQAHRVAQAAGRGFVVSGAPAQLVQLATLYGVEALLSLSAPAAMAAPAELPASTPATAGPPSGTSGASGVPVGPAGPDAVAEPSTPAATPFTST